MRSKLLVGWLCCFLFFTLLHVQHQRDTLAVKNKLLRKAIHNQQWEINQARSRNQEMDKLRWMRRATELRHPDWALITQTIYRKSREYRLRPDLVLAIAHRESNFEPFAQSPFALGIMQINYNVWKDFFGIDEEDMFDIENNIDAGCRILRMYLNETGGDEAKALLYYNCGYRLSNPQYVPRIQSSKFYRRQDG